MRDAIKVGLIEGPRVYCASRMIGNLRLDRGRRTILGGDVLSTSIGVLANTAGRWSPEVRRRCKHGVDFIKMADSRSGEAQTISREEIAAVVSEAHRHNVRVAIHSRGSASTRAAAAEAGVGWIMHTDLATEADLEAVAKAGVRIVPTATFVERVLEFGRKLARTRFKLALTG